MEDAMPEPLLLFAKISPKPAFLALAREAVLAIIDKTLEEPGCRRFALLEGQDDGCLYLDEEWEDDAALQAHYAEDYTQGVFKTYLAKPVEAVKLRRLS
jgi:quinol monooxygenase YgiN